MAAVCVDVFCVLMCRVLRGWYSDVVVVRCGVCVASCVWVVYVCDLGKISTVLRLIPFLSVS